MTIEDINDACGYTPTSTPERYAFYPNGTSVSGTITYNGNIYEKTVDKNGTAFYTYDGGGVEKTDSNGFKYRTPEKNNPVYVTDTSYYFDVESDYSKFVENSNITFRRFIRFSLWLDSFAMCRGNLE